MALAALAGLRAPRGPGRGVHVDLAQFEAVSYVLGDLLMAESLTEPGRRCRWATATSEHAPWGLFRGAATRAWRRWIGICVLDDADWSALVDVAGGAVPDVDAWRTESGRLGAAGEIEAAVAAWVRDQDGRDLEERLQAVGIAAGAALHPRLQVEHPAFAGRGYPVAIEQPGSGPLVLEGPALTGSRMGSPRCGPAPALSQHTAQILHDLLGIDAEGVAALVRGGAIDAVPENTPTG